MTNMWHYPIRGSDWLNQVSFSQQSDKSS
jgi:hypothetical protein